MGSARNYACVTSAFCGAFKGSPKGLALRARDGCATQGLNQPVKEGRLRFLQFAPRFFHREETGLIDFGKVCIFLEAGGHSISKLFEQT